MKRPDPDYSSPEHWIPSVFMLLLAAIIGGIALALGGCAHTPEKRQAIATALLADARAVLSDSAQRALSDAVAQAATGGKIDFAHAAAAGLYAQVSADNVRKVVMDATGGTLPQLADAAQKVVAAEIANGTGQQAALVAVANAISANALTQ